MTMLIVIFVSALLITSVVGQGPNQGKLPCSNTRCASGYACENRQLPCSQPPCGSFPTCVTGDSVGQFFSPHTYAVTCSTLTCLNGYRCIMKSVPCFSPPCGPIPTCVISGEPGEPFCNNVICPPSTTCKVIENRMTRCV